MRKPLTTEEKLTSVRKGKGGLTPKKQKRPIRMGYLAKKGAGRRRKDWNYPRMQVRRKKRD